MDHFTWLKDDSEFPPLGSGANDYVIVSHDDEWERVDVTTWADIVNRNTPAPPPPPSLKKSVPAARLSHKDTFEPMETSLYDLAITQKSRARRRHHGEAWMHQHRVRVLTRIGYGSNIQGYVYDEQIEQGLLPSDFVPPVHYPSFIHCWRYVCKEDPEPEVDRLRKSKVRSLLDLTS